jgi:hypothetical protein
VSDDLAAMFVVVAFFALMIGFAVWPGAKP